LKNGLFFTTIFCEEFLDNMYDFGRLFILFGILMVGIGFLIIFTSKIPFLGKLPGDIYYHKDGFTFYFPRVTSIIISIILSLIFKFFNK